MKIDYVKLRIVEAALNRLMEWALKTLKRLTKTSNTLLIWLKSTTSRDPNKRAFRLPQEPTTVKTYVNQWRQFIFYCIRTALLDEATRERVYGIKFTEDQMRIIGELMQMLDMEMDEEHELWSSREDEDEDEDEDIYPYDPDEDDEDDEENDDDILDEEDNAMLNENREETGEEEEEDSLTVVAEKLMELSIAFITQHFPEGDDLHSSLVHFANVLGISNRFGRFAEPYNYTSYLAALMWMSRLFVMEYALPGRKYITLHWYTYAEYNNPSERLKAIHQKHLTLGSFGPINQIVQMLTIGRELVKKVGRLGLLMWVKDYQSVKIRNVELSIDVFKDFVRSGLESTRKILTNIKS